MSAILLFFIGTFCARCQAASKPHIITFGKWITVKWNADADETKSAQLKIRPLYVDGHLREYVFGALHEITERIFVARRAFRINDDLPDETSATPHWLWQRGGWIVVDRINGHISPINFPGFDSYYSVGEWYRDYFAYCSLAEDGKKISAEVVELGKRKPLIKQSLGELTNDAGPDSACATLLWQRSPARVTFQTTSGQKVSFTVRGNFAGEITTSQDENDDNSN